MKLAVREHEPIDVASASDLPAIYGRLATLPDDLSASEAARRLRGR
jgi:hypothetical protein